MLGNWSEISGKKKMFTEDEKVIKNNSTHSKANEFRASLGIENE